MEIEKKLSEHYSDRESGILLGTWLRIKISGKKSARKTMNKGTYYRHLSRIEKAGIKIENDEMEDLKNGNYEVYRFE